jgi:hypothetical protein
LRRRRRVDDLSRYAVGDEVLNPAINARPALTAAHSVHEPLVDLADQPFGDGLSAFQVLRHQVERLAIIQQLAHIVGPRILDRLSRPHALCLFDRQLRAFDMGRVMRFQQQRPLAHPPYPFFGECRRFQKSARPLDRRQPGLSNQTESGGRGTGLTSCGLLAC